MRSIVILFHFLLCMSPIEIAATLFGLVSVYLTIKENIWCWPTGIIMVILYVFVFYDAKLYSDVMLQVIYIFMQAYGWYFWVYGGKKEEKVHVITLKLRERIMWFFVAIIGAAAWGYVMHTYTDASLPYTDSLIVVMSLIAQWFLAKKVLESWVLWIAVDVLALYVYSAKGLYLTTGLYAVFLILAIKGLIEWRKSFKTQAAVPGHVA